MAETLIGLVAEFVDPPARVRVVDGREIGVFRIGNEYFAYENLCPHAGGPLCQGRRLPRTLEILGPDKTSIGLAFSSTDLHIVCPWHGYEFDIRTGRHPGNPDLVLKRYPIRVDGDRILVTI